jgi:hypothetical protein
MLQTHYALQESRSSFAAEAAVCSMRHTLVHNNRSHAQLPSKQVLLINLVQQQ